MKHSLSSFDPFFNFLLIFRHYRKSSCSEQRSQSSHTAAYLSYWLTKLARVNTGLLHLIMQLQDSKQVLFVCISTMHCEKKKQVRTHWGLQIWPRWTTIPRHHSHRHVSSTLSIILLILWFFFYLPVVLSFGFFWVFLDLAIARSFTNWRLRLFLIAVILASWFGFVQL